MVAEVYNKEEFCQQEMNRYELNWRLQGGIRLVIQNYDIKMLHSIIQNHIKTILHCNSFIQLVVKAFP